MRKRKPETAAPTVCREQKVWYIAIVLHFTAIALPCFRARFSHKYTRRAIVTSTSNFWRGKTSCFSQFTQFTPIFRYFWGFLNNKKFNRNGRPCNWKGETTLSAHKNISAPFPSLPFLLVAKIKRVGNLPECSPSVQLHQGGL